jgi:hypothetical protein
LLAKAVKNQMICVTRRRYEYKAAKVVLWLIFGSINMNANVAKIGVIGNCFGRYSYAL